MKLSEKYLEKLREESHRVDDKFRNVPILDAQAYAKICELEVALEIWLWIWEKSYVGNKNILEVKAKENIVLCRKKLTEIEKQL